jgi:pyrroline-5-carboxylate reductase
MLETKISIIGCGNMGSAIARGMVEKKIVPAGAILLSDTDESKARALAEKTGAKAGGLEQAVKLSDCLIIAVKPQDSGRLLDEMSSYIKGQTVVSVMAGVKIKDITGRLGKEVPVVRAMPNVASFVGEGITCISRNSIVTNLEDMKKLFSGIGRVLEVKEEALDAVTALSGSGPAYLFYLADAMISAGKKAGLDEAAAKELVVQTLYGSALLLRNAEVSAEELIKKVASKGGTTEAALSVFEENKMRSIIEEAVEKAEKRSEELSRG